MTTLTRPVASTPDIDGALRWDPPGPGLWQRETTHIPGGAVPIFQEIAPEAVAAGTSRMAQRYGLPVSHVAFRFVNDRIFMRAIPSIGEKPRKAPPPPILRVLSRLHPALRPRVRAAAKAVNTRQWRVDGERWYSEQKPAMTARWRGHQAVQLDDLTDVQLTDHLMRLRTDLAGAVADHFDLHGCDQIPVGELLIACEGWGISHDEALNSLRGFSPSSLGERDRLGRIAAAVRTTGETATTLPELRALGPEIAAEVDAYLADHGCRTVTSYDPGGQTLSELPELITASILALVDQPPTGDPAATAAPLRARVPEAERARFNELLIEARFAWGIRDDHVGITFLWPAGLVRTALLEVGRRLVSRGTASIATDALELRSDEVAGALAGEGPDAAALTDRAMARASHAAAAAPYYIGAEPPPPSFDSFPRAMARVTSGFVTCMNLWWNPVEREQLKGVGAGSVAYRGVARVTTTAEDAVARLGVGDVLIAPFTTPAYNPGLVNAGAVVVEEGGALCHAAIVARELGIPAVVGALGVVAAVNDGDLVDVDPLAGSVRVVERR